MRVHRNCLVEFKSGIKQSLQEGKLGGEDLCGMLEMGGYGKERTQQVVCCRARDENGETDLEKREDR